MATKWGVVSAGKISHDFVTAVQSMEDGQHEFVAVAARNLASAEEFALTHGILKAYGSYEDLAKDPDIEVIYVGTITRQHFAVGKMMLENGKHVLMEKAMTMSAKQTKALVDIARKNKRFLMEALWSRFFPANRFLMDYLKKGNIGEIVHVHSNFGVKLTEEEHTRFSTILDVGIYTLNAVSMVYNGEKPQKVAAVGHLNDKGVDIAVACSLLYSNNRTATVASTITAEMANDMTITGTKGCVKLPKNMWCPVIVETSEKTYEFPLPDTKAPCNYVHSSGLRYEAIEVRECLKRGALESLIMPLEDSIKLAEIMDEIRQQIGVKHED